MEILVFKVFFVFVSYFFEESVFFYYFFVKKLINQVFSARKNHAATSLSFKDEKIINFVINY